MRVKDTKGFESIMTGLHQAKEHQNKRDFFNKVYTLLVDEAGARENMRDNFMYSHLDTRYPCTEYRFQGYFGFGGKYYSERNRVSYYLEDETPELNLLEKNVNELLSRIPRA